MKYIFDFDGVLFKSKEFKEHTYKCLEEAGVERGSAEDYYSFVRENEFSLKDFLERLLKSQGLGDKADKVYEEVMRECPNFVNRELFEAVRRIGPDNCYIVTKGNREFQLDKIGRSGFGEIFSLSHIYTTPDKKGKYIKEICDRNQESEFVFIDDNLRVTEEPALKTIPNLTTIHYKSEEFEKLMREKGNLGSELKRRK